VRLFLRHARNLRQGERTRRRGKEEVLRHKANVFR
jgi:hypothetical protein